MFQKWLFRLWKVHWLAYHLVLKTLARVLPFPQPTLLIGNDSLQSLGIFCNSVAGHVPC